MLLFVFGILLLPHAFGYGPQKTTGQGKKNPYPPPRIQNVRPDAQCAEVITTQTAYGQEIQQSTANCLDFPSDLQLQSIENLVVTNKTISELTVPVYISSGILRKLSLSYCDISDIQGNVFITTPNLDIVDLSDNRLTVIRADTFQGLVNLVSLNLERNQINSVDTGAFLGSPSLQILDLSFNNLHKIPEYLPHSLLILSMRDNVVEYINGGASLPRLEELDLCDNKVESVTAPLEIPDLKILCVGNGQLNLPKEFLENSNLDALKEVTFIGGGELTVFPTELFSFLHDKLLHKLSIKDYSLQVLAPPLSLTHLELIRVKVDKSINVSPIIPCGPKLVYLDLTGSPVLAQLILTNSDLLKALNSLKQLKLGGCGITNLKWIDVTSHPRVLLPQLATCDISESTIDCSDQYTNFVLCNPHHSTQTSTIFIGLNTVTCKGTNQKWTKTICASVTSPTAAPRTTEIYYPDDITLGGLDDLYTGDHESLTEDEWRKWYIVIGAVCGLFVIILISVIMWCCLKRKKSANIREKEYYDRAEAEEMLPKGHK